MTRVQQDHDFEIGAVLAQVEDLDDRGKVAVLYEALSQVRDRLRPANVNDPRLPRALAVSNGDDPPCFALVCPVCKSVDECRPMVLAVDVRGKRFIRIDMAGLICNRCETWLNYPTMREVQR